MLTKSKIKFIQSLSHKKFRDEAGAFVAEGPKLFRELIALDNLQVLEIYATSDWIKREPIAQNFGSIITEIEPSYLERISSLSTPNQVLAIFRKPVFTTVEAKGYTLVLDSIQDPGNLGTIIRTADWFGIADIVCSADCVDAFNSKVVQSTMGSIGRVKVVYRDIVQLLTGMTGVPVFAATLDGDDIYTMDKPGIGFIVIGNEAHGISPELLALSTQRITIPKRGRAESLNASVAAAIIMSEFCR